MTEQQTEAPETPAAPELDPDQQLYEALFGEQPEWHAPSSQPTTEDDDGEDVVYERLFGTDPATERNQP